MLPSVISNIAQLEGLYEVVLAFVLLQLQFKWWELLILYVSLLMFRKWWELLILCVSLLIFRKLLSAEHATVKEIIEQIKRDVEGLKEHTQYEEYESE